MPRIRLGAVEIEVTPDLVTTTLPSGKKVYGAPHDTLSYRQTAEDHGYGDDVARLNRTHEVAHSLLANLLGLECSPTFARLAEGATAATDVTRDEEAAVLGLERFANRMGVNLLQVAQKTSSQNSKQALPPGYRVLNDGPDREVLVRDDCESCWVFPNVTGAIEWAWLLHAGEHPDAGPIEVKSDFP